MLKGKATIELTNVKTGEVEVYEEENMITNAVQDILNMNPVMRHYDILTGISNYSLLPIVPNLIGGILLYANPLEEDATKYYASDDNILIGYSSNVVNIDADPLRGSMNQTESKRVGNGYKFVFDFQTSQGNGTISSLGLTSRWGGTGGYGSKYEQTPLLTLGEYSISFNSYTAMTPFIHICSYDEKTDTFISAQLTANNTVVLKRINAKSWKIGLFSNYGFRTADIISTITITTENFGNYLSSTSTNKRSAFLDDKVNNCIWGLDTAGNSSGNGVIQWIKINKNDFTFEEGSWTLPNTTLAQLAYSYSNDDQAHAGKSTHSIIKDGYLYCCQYSRQGIYKINLTNPEDILFIPGTIDIYEGDTSSGKTYLTTNTTFNIVGNIIFFKNGYIMNDTIYPISTATQGLVSTIHSSLTFGPYLITPYRYYYSSSYYLYHNVQLMTPYLATINNLENPIEKTEDKTMKITYILTEVEDEEETV